MKKILTIIIYFLLLVAYLTGAVGGFIALICLNYWPIALCVAFVGYMAFPKAQEYFREMMQ